MNESSIAQLDTDQQVELIVAVVARLADIIADPTDGGKKEVSADTRKQMRADAKDQLITCVETMASLCNAMHGFYDVLSIGTQLNVKTPSAT